jgi:membrane protease subunit HflK
VLYESRQEIAIEVRERMQQMLDRYGTGILVSVVAIQNAQPPEQVQAAFDDAVKAGQDRERQINEGQAYANDVVPKARGFASRLMQEAEGYRTRVVESAQGDASRFRQILTEYQKAPAVTRDRLYIETMQQVYSNTTKVMVDTRQNNQLLYLPFDKLMQQALQDSAAPRPAPLAAEPAPPAETTRGRDTSLRSRDR